MMTAPTDAQALADRLTDLATRPAALSELRRWSEVLAAGRSWPAVARQHLALYEEVVADAQRAARRRLRAG
jgi:hypothetical protein